MRRLLSTMVLVLILAGLVGYIYFVDRNRETNDADSKEKVRSALNRATRKGGRHVATASDDTFLYVWNEVVAPAK